MFDNAAEDFGLTGLNETFSNKRRRRVSRKKEEQIPAEILAMSDEELKKRTLDFSNDPELDELLERRDAAQEAVTNHLAFKYAMQKEYLKRLSARVKK